MISMSIKGDYYKLDKESFEQKLKYIKESEDTFKFFSNTNQEYFYYETPTISKKVLELYKKQWKFDVFLKSFSKFGQNQLLQSYLIEEINSTNEIENIYSTRHDIFYILKNSDININSKIKTITNQYLFLLENGPKNVNNKKDIRNLYDDLLLDGLKEEDKPDGKYFRRNQVFISDGLKNIHSGLYPEKQINECMDEFLKLINSKKEYFIKNIIGHFMIETIHPYYDGNGRIGRFLFSNQLLQDSNSYSSLLIAKAFNESKSKYYKAFKEGRDVRQFGCINEYVEIILDILISGFEKNVKDLDMWFIKINSDIKDDLNKSEEIVYKLLREATLLSNYGVSNNELIDYSGLSRRTIASVMNSFKEAGLLLDTTIGRTSYHKLKSEIIK